MKYIDKWLENLGLEYIIPKLEKCGINTPKKLAKLSLKDMYELVGIEDPEHRKKLYYLIQRLQQILEKTNSNDQENSPEIQSKESNDVPIEIATKKTDISKDKIESVSIDNNAIDSSTEDLQSLRRKHANILIPSEQPIKQSSVALSPSDRPIRPSSHGNAYDLTSVPDAIMTESNLETKEPKESKRSSFLLRRKGQVKIPKQTPNVIEPPQEVRSCSPIIVMESPSRMNKSPPPSVIPNIIKPRPQSFEDIERVTMKPIASKASPETEQISEDIYNNLHIDNKQPFVDLAIRVVVRKRPLNKLEVNRGDRDVLEIESNGIVKVHEPKIKVDLTKIVETTSFIFDDAFDSSDCNAIIYNRTVRPLVNSIFSGGKATCFAYGQTGSGKTFSMMGNKLDNDNLVDTSKAGLYVLAARDIFSILKQSNYKHMQLYVSCFEIYGGKLFDLLNDRGIVKCLEDSKQQVQIFGLTEHQVDAVDGLLSLMQTAHDVRSTGATGANSESSRSHLIMQIEIKERNEKAISAAAIANRRHSFLPQPQAQQVKMNVVGKLSFIDLAGSERGADTTHNSKQTRLEGAEINTSLLALKEVIRSLARKTHTPFRGSKLTQVLKDSFVGENTRTCMIACVSPSSGNCEHTLNTLRYADRVKEHSRINPNGNNNGNNIEDSNIDLDEDLDNPLDEELDDNNDEVSLHLHPKRPATAGVIPPSITNLQTNNEKVLRSSDEKLNKILRPNTANPRMSMIPNPIKSENTNITNIKKSIRRQTMFSQVKDISSIPTTSNSKIPIPGIALEAKGVHHPILVESQETEALEALTPSQSPPITRSSIDSIQMTVNLLTNHKMAIANMVDIMKEEMQLVQDMENSDDRNSEVYVDKLEGILNSKLNDITDLRNQLVTFQKHKNAIKNTNIESQKSTSNKESNTNVLKTRMNNVSNVMSRRTSVGVVRGKR